MTDDLVGRALRAPRSIRLTDPEIAQIRRALLHVEHQAQDLVTNSQPVPVIVARLGEAVAGVRYLLERAEQRRGLH